MNADVVFIARSEEAGPGFVVRNAGSNPWPLPSFCVVVSADLLMYHVYGATPSFECFEVAPGGSIRIPVSEFDYRYTIDVAKGERFSALSWWDVSARAQGLTGPTDLLIGPSARPVIFLIGSLLSASSSWIEKIPWKLPESPCAPCVELREDAQAMGTSFPAVPPPMGKLEEGILMLTWSWTRDREIADEYSAILVRPDATAQPPKP